MPPSHLPAVPISFQMLEGLVRMGTAQRQDAEVQFKAQKKLLVKEIKSLRLAVATLQVRGRVGYCGCGCHL